MAYFFLYIHVADRNFKTSLNNISNLETILFDCQVIGINKKKHESLFFYSCNRIDSVRILLKVYNFFLISMFITYLFFSLSSQYNRRICISWSNCFTFLTK